VRVTSPFRGLVHPETQVIHRPSDFPDVYGGIGSDSRPQPNFMRFVSALHAAVAFSRATLSASDSFAASAGVGMNAVPLQYPTLTNVRFWG
jgi:hypothetical protein